MKITKENSTHSRATDSFLTYTDNPQSASIHSTDSIKDIINKSLKDETNVHDLNKDDLEKFYEERQSLVEDALLRKSFNSTKSSRKATNQNKNIRSSRAITTACDKVISYDQFKKDKPMHRSNSAKVLPKTKEKKEQKEICFKLKITNDSVEEIVNTEENTKRIANEQNKNSTPRYGNSFRTSNRSKNDIRLVKSKDKLSTQTGNTNLSTKNKVTVVNYSSLKTLGDEIQTDTNDNVENLITSHNLTETGRQENNINSMHGRHLSLRSIKLNSEIEKKFEGDINRSKSLVNSDIVSRSSNIIDSNYANEIKQIYQKRKLCQARESKCTEFFNKFYVDNVEWKKKAMKKSLVLKQKLDEITLNQCSFTPKMSESTRKLLSEKKIKREGDFYTQNMIWKQNIEKQKQTQHLINERKEYEECFFQPQTNKSIHKLGTETIKQSDDYVYVKNINWLKKVQENRKKMDLEQLEELRKSAELSKTKRKLPVWKKKQNDSLSPEDLLKSNLLHTVTSPRALSTIVTGQSENKYDNYSHFWKEDTCNVEKEIKEIKTLINSLKQTLEDNKAVVSTTFPKMEDDSCNKTSPKNQMMKCTKVNFTQSDLNEKYEQLMEKFNKQKHEENKE